MGWESLLFVPSEEVLPWYGGQWVHSSTASLRIRGRRPPEWGWYRFRILPKGVEVIATAEIDPDYCKSCRHIRGYIIGDRLIPDDVRVTPDPQRLIEQTRRLHLIERGLPRFARALAVENRVGDLIFIQQEWQKGPEAAVLEAYQDRVPMISGIPEVTPALDLAFRWMSFQRDSAERLEVERVEALRREEAARQEAERLRVEQEARAQRQHELMENLGSAVVRRQVAEWDFETAAREALRVSGAELLDVRDSYRRGEKVVQYRIGGRRMECVVDAHTLRVIDSGICLDGQDALFSLESLPGVILQGEDEGRLVIYRRLDDDD